MTKRGRRVTVELTLAVALLIGGVLGISTVILVDESAGNLLTSFARRQFPVILPAMIAGMSAGAVAWGLAVRRTFSLDELIEPVKQPGNPPITAEANGSSRGRIPSDVVGRPRSCARNDD